MLPASARYFIAEIPVGTAERVYALDFSEYCMGKEKGYDTQRPDVAEYQIGVRVAEYIRKRIDPDKA